MKFLLRWLATAIAVAVALALVPGITILGGYEGWFAIVLFALVLALINASIKPILQFFSFPVTLLTLGIFALVVNTAMLYLAAWIANGIFDVGFAIGGFWSAFFASIIISIVAALVNSITGANREKSSDN